jgi:hypothetical protein
MREFLIDTDILSIFAKANGLSTLCRLLECEKLPITPGLLDELLVPLEYGYDFPRDILSMAEIVVVMSGEIEGYEHLKLQGRLSTTDAEIIAICKQRGWLYITMDKVALRAAQAADVNTVDLEALLKAIKRIGLLDREQLQALIERMECQDRTRLPYKETLLAVEEEK